MLWSEAKDYIMLKEVAAEGMLLKREMGNREWDMKNGEWEMGNRKWEIQNWKLNIFYINLL